jgi:hypothetical protein
MLLASEVVAGPSTSDRISTLVPDIVARLDAAIPNVDLASAICMDLALVAAVCPCLLARYGCERVAVADGPSTGVWGAVG